MVSDSSNSAKNFEGFVVVGADFRISDRFCIVHSPKNSDFSLLVDFPVTIRH